MMRLTPILALSIGLGLSAPALAASHGSEQGAAQSEGSQAQSQQQMQQDQAMPQGRRMVIGEVTDTRGVQIKGPAGDKHRLLKLNANENTVIVDLGPMQEQAFKDLGINQGTRIWALGSSARINGKPALYARYVGEVYDFKPNYQGGQGASQSSAKPNVQDGQSSSQATTGSEASQKQDDPDERGWFDW